MVSTISWIPWTVTSGRLYWTYQHRRGNAQKWLDVGPRRPTHPPFSLATVTCSHGLPELTISRVSLGSVCRKASTRGLWCGSSPNGRKSAQTLWASSRCGGNGPRIASAAQASSALAARLSLSSTNAEDTNRSGGTWRSRSKASNPARPKVEPANRSRKAILRVLGGAASPCTGFGAESCRGNSAGCCATWLASKLIHRSCPRELLSVGSGRDITWTVPANVQTMRATSISLAPMLRNGDSRGKCSALGMMWQSLSSLE